MDCEHCGGTLRGDIEETDTHRGIRTEHWLVCTICGRDREATEAEAREADGEWLELINHI